MPKDVKLLSELGQLSGKLKIVRCCPQSAFAHLGDLGPGVTLVGALLKLNTRVIICAPAASPRVLTGYFQQ